MMNLFHVHRQVHFATATLKVFVKGVSVLAGELEQPVLASDCTWEVDDGKLVLGLVKSTKAKACGRENPEGWWSRILKQVSMPIDR